MAGKQEIELLDAASNAVVARHRDRSFPGVLIQGDTLRTFLDEIEELCDEASAGDHEAVKDIADHLKERFVEILKHYEQVLDKHGIDLPCANSVRN